MNPTTTIRASRSCCLLFKYAAYVLKKVKKFNCTIIKRVLIFILLFLRVNGLRTHHITHKSVSPFVFPVDGGNSDLLKILPFSTTS